MLTCAALLRAVVSTKAAPVSTLTVCRFVVDRLGRLTLHWLVAMCPPVRTRGIHRPSPDKELNIAQHARRQAARKAASAPRFFC